MQLAAAADIGAGHKGRRCQETYFAAENRLLDGDRNQARDLFKRSLATEARNWRDYGSARRN